MPLNQRLRALLAAAVLVVTAACATNALRIEAAADVAQKGKFVAAASRGYLADVERARYAMNSDIIAADAACRDPRATFRYPLQTSRITDPRNPPRGWLCEPLPAGADRRQGVMLGPINRELEPTLLLIQSLSDYVSAITKVLEADRPNPVEDINNALATARAAEGLLRALAGSGDTLVPAADDKRLTAVTNLIGFLAELANEQATVDELRALRDRGLTGGTTIAALIEHIDNWERSRRDSERFGIDLSDRLLTAAAEPDSPLNAEQRRRFADDYYTRVRTQTASAQLAEALKIALNGLQNAEADYQRLLQEHPQLTPEERARRAELMRQRLTRAFELAASLIVNFRGM